MMIIDTDDTTIALPFACDSSLFLRRTPKDPPFFVEDDSFMSYELHSHQFIIDFFGFDGVLYHFFVVVLF
jgi:hypothetical protein